MMVLYSGTTGPYSHRCRFVLFEKGMDFEIRDVDLFAKPEDIALMNPYNEVPILVERDLILYESNIINEYIDERFPHPQLMPGDPVARARVRLFLFNFEKELFVHVNVLEGRGIKGTDKQLEKARSQIRDRLTQLAPIFLKNKYMLGRRLLDARRRDRAAAVAPRLLRHRHVEERGAAAEVRRAHLLAPGLHRGADAVREGDAQVSASASRRMTHAPPIAPATAGTSTRPYLIRALHDWCTDNGFTPYIAVFVDAPCRCRREYVKNNEIVLNIGFEATSALKLGNETIEFKARFGGTLARDRRADRSRDRDLCARERPGHGVPDADRRDGRRRAERRGRGAGRRPPAPRAAARSH